MTKHIYIDAYTMIIIDHRTKERLAFIQNPGSTPDVGEYIKLGGDEYVVQRIEQEYKENGTQEELVLVAKM